MENDEITAAIGQLAERIARLEDHKSERPPRQAVPVRDLIDAVGNDGDGPATVVFAGAGAWDGGIVAWEMARPWNEVRESAGDDTARVLTALGSAVRLRIVAALLGGAMATHELVDRLDLGSSGQLFHHLKELLAAGVIHQPVRGTYAVRRQHVVPLLAVLAATIDLVGPPTMEEPA